MAKLAIIIPARMESTRFQGKVLHPILGKPLVVQVAKGASECAHADRVIVATDDERVLKAVEEAGYEARMTSPDHPSGTDRVWEVAKSLDAEWIINLQGDEPLITGEVLDSIAEVVTRDESAGHEIVTMVRPLEPREAIDPNRVKVVTDRDMNALYFSRSPIPYVKDRPIIMKSGGIEYQYLLHVGLYLYRRNILEKFVSLEQTPLEISEGLEQLRALENGIRIHCVLTDHEFLGVDTKSDVPRVEAALRAREAKSGK
jgi:3-deoxy-manno-octulosonate cytidylyltransferase (CMP-KDO synthetase)